MGDGYCPIFDKFTDPDHGKRCTAFEPNSQAQARQALPDAECSETPRTDEMREAYVNFQHGKYTADVGDVFDFARKLERELAEAKSEIRRHQSA
jgi:hypothetical protein